MTGFGRAENTVGSLGVLVEIKSLNGKQLELNLRIPPLLKSYEFDIRNLLSANLGRGSVDCNITLRQNGASKPVGLNTDLIKSYYHTLLPLGAELNADMGQILAAILRLPEVVQPITDVLDADGWQLVLQTLTEALANLNQHRSQEGAVLQAELETRIGHIAAAQKLIEALAPERQIKIKEGIRKKLEEVLGKDQLDQSRLEQELIFYVEKIDITEEMLRLGNHCDYFFTVLRSADEAKGKKLGFVLQEIGREINTTGAKAYDAEIQKHVVLMKDELEKVKEQVLNVL
ncbi:MAG: YicC family protein [Bacteroidetes bacterium]|nr:MAG: YicC family protein [Bacteroidota bacterium]